MLLHIPVKADKDGWFTFRGIFNRSTVRQGRHKNWTQNLAISQSGSIPCDATITWLLTRYSDAQWERCDTTSPSDKVSPGIKELRWRKNRCASCLQWLQLNVRFILSNISLPLMSLSPIPGFIACTPFKHVCSSEDSQAKPESLSSIWAKRKENFLILDSNYVSRCARGQGLKIKVPGCGVPLQESSCSVCIPHWRGAMSRVPRVPSFHCSQSEASFCGGELWHHKFYSLATLAMFTSCTEAKCHVKHSELENKRGSCFLVLAGGDVEALRCLSPTGTHRRW